MIPVTLSIAFKRNQVTNVSVNGNTQNLVAGSDCDMISQTFHNGDVIIFSICANIKIVPLGQSKDVFCVMYGNILLAKTAGKFSRNDSLITSEEFIFTNKHSTFKPLYEIEDEVYTVYINSK